MKKKKGGLADIIQKMESGQSGKMAAKLPLWAETEGIRLPESLALQQCSSQLTADCKANLLKSLLPETGCIADLTGGFGVDSFAFSQVFGKVLYFERNAGLCEITRQNLALLAQSRGRPCNIHCECKTVDGQSIAELVKTDCIYLDPARRSDTGKKVFLLEDCTPDVLGLLPDIARTSPALLLKLSPMADISMLRNRLDGIVPEYRIRSIGIIGIKGEVKEILVLMSRLELPEAKELFILNCENPDSLLVIGNTLPAPRLAEDVKGFRYLLEPDALLLKTGAHCLIENAVKLSPDCHIYLSNTLPQGPSALHFKAFEIKEAQPLDKHSLKEFGAKYHGAAVTARAIPLSSEELAEKMKTGRNTSENLHIFGAGTGRGRFLFACYRL